MHTLQINIRPTDAKEASEDFFIICTTFKRASMTKWKGIVKTSLGDVCRAYNLTLRVILIYYELFDLQNLFPFE